MIKQKICIIGGGLTGLITAITLSKLNLSIDLVTNDLKQNTKSNRTTAISQSNCVFLKKLDALNLPSNCFWPCSEMKLYAEKKDNYIFKILELKENKKKINKILYMFENSKMHKILINKINKIKNISLKSNTQVSQIIPSAILKNVKFNNNSYKYNLVILCTGYNSVLVEKFFGQRSLKRSYNEISVTTILKHSYLKNNISRQIFLNDGILALLPISNIKTSVVWSVKKNIVNSNFKKKDLFFRKKIKFYAGQYLKKIKFVTNLQYRNLNCLIRKSYYQDRTLLFGDALHVVHPLAGQGFNMILRDLINLKKVMKNKIDLGLDIGSVDILQEFTDIIKPRNFIYAAGIDFIKNCFSVEKQSLKDFRNKIVLEINKNNFVKNTFFDIADRGI